jgi:hypothetical protein
MAIRFWRRQRLFPGVRINVSKSGASLSVGRRGAHHGPLMTACPALLPGAGC